MEIKTFRIWKTEQIKFKHMSLQCFTLYVITVIIITIIISNSTSSNRVYSIFQFALSSCISVSPSFPWSTYVSYVSPLLTWKYPYCSFLIMFIPISTIIHNSIHLVPHLFHLFNVIYILDHKFITHYHPGVRFKIAKAMHFVILY
jgi:hypothetical protein